MPKPIIYEIDLRELISKKIHAAEDNMLHFEGTVERTKGILGELGGMLGTGFALFEGFEFLKDSLKDFEKAEDAMAQLRAGIESTGGIAGETFEDMVASAKRFSEEIPYSKAELMSMQSILLTFPAITKESFDETTGIIADMSTRLHRGLEETAIQVGKAMQDPIKGITALRRVGVNFDETQTKIIKNLVNTGHKMEAQRRILHELNVEFGGSSAAAAKTFSGQMKIMGQQLEEDKEKLGEFLSEGIIALKPEIRELIHDFGDFVKWLREHKEAIASVTKVVIEIVKWYLEWKVAIWALNKAEQGLLLLQGAKTFFFASTVEGATAATVATEELTTATVAAGSALKGTFAAVAAGFLLWDQMNKQGERMAHKDPREIENEWGAAIDQVETGGGDANAFAADYMHQMATADPGTRAKMEAFMKKMPGDIQKAFETVKSIQTPIAEISKDDKKKKKKFSDNTDHSLDNSGVSKVTGNHPVNITINIHDGLVKNFTIQTTNLREGSARVKEEMTRAIAGAINDSQLISER